MLPVYINIYIRESITLPVCVVFSSHKYIYKYIHIFVNQSQELSTGSMCKAAFAQQFIGTNSLLFRMDKYNKLDFALSWREWFVVQFSALWQGNTYLNTQSMGFFCSNASRHCCYHSFVCQKICNSGNACRPHLHFICRLNCLNCSQMGLGILNENIPGECSVGWDNCWIQTSSQMR